MNARTANQDLTAPNAKTIYARFMVRVAPRVFPNQILSIAQAANQDLVVPNARTIYATSTVPTANPASPSPMTLN